MNDRSSLYRLDFRDWSVVIAARTLLWKVVRSNLPTATELESIARSLQVLTRLPDVGNELSARVELSGPERRYGDHSIT